MTWLDYVKIALLAVILVVVIELVLSSSDNKILGEPLSARRKRWRQGVLYFAILGLLFAGFGGGVIYQGTKTQRWPQTEGTVLTSDIYITHGKGGPSYHNRIRYAYQVGESSYTNDRVQIGYGGTDAFRAQATLSEFAVSAAVPVYYDPTAPGSSVLIQGYPPFFATWFGLGAVAVLAAGVVWFQAPKADEA